MFINTPSAVSTTTTRHPKSVDSSTKPLRSSPLAGPSLNRSLTPAVSNNDQLLKITTPPLCHGHSKSCQPIDSSSSHPFCDSSSSSSTAFRRRSYVPIAGGSGRSQPSSVFDSARASSSKKTLLTAAAVSEWEIDPLQNPIPPRARLRLGISSSSFHRRPIPIVEEEDDQVDIEPSTTTTTNSSTSEFTHPRSMSISHHTRDNSWYTANPYDVTPRFSRLGLSASTVVMPLSAKQHRRLSRNTSRAGSSITNTNASTHTNTGSTSSTSSSTSPTIKRFSIISALGPKSPTRISLQPPSQPLSRTIGTTSISDTFHLASTPTSQPRTPISLSAPPSLTRSRDYSDDSLSLSSSSSSSSTSSYESCYCWSPTTPPFEQDMVFLPVEDDREACEGEGKMDDGEMGGVVVVATAEVRGHRDHCSDITTKNDLDDDEEGEEENEDDDDDQEELTLNPMRIEQPKKPVTYPVLYPQPQPQLPPTTTPPTPPPTPPPSPPPPRTTTNPPFQNIKKGRHSIRRNNKLVRIKLQPVDVHDDDDDLEDSSVSNLSVNKTVTTTMTIIPILPLESITAVSPTVDSEKDTFMTSNVLLVPQVLSTTVPTPTPSLKRQRSTLKNVLKCFIGKW